MYVPAAQAWHAEKPAPEEKVPARQPIQDTLPTAPSAVAYVPARQPVQAIAPVVDTYVPAVQAWQAE
jgi:hypothetical protein